MARHRSPSSRRAHLGSPLSFSLATAGAGGGAASLQLPLLSSANRKLPPALPVPPLPTLHIPAPRLPESVSQLTSSLPARLIATALAGGALAAAGQHALADALPRALEGTNMLRIGVEGVLGAQAPTEVITYEAVAVAPVAPAPAVATAADLVKAADLERAAAEAAAASATAAATAAAAQAKAAEAAKAVPAVVAGGVQMIVGKLTSIFGSRWGTLHQGIDIAAPIGTPIRVPLAGTVVSSGPADGFGMWVRVQHADGAVSVYGHINRSFVKVGQQVAAGFVIAEVGNRGQSTGPHLHIGLEVNGTYVNPRPWLDRNGVKY